jgi:carboxypeptidase Taq
MSTTPVTAPLERLRAVLAEIADLHHAEMLLEWDSRVSMPHAGARARADVTATVGKLAHERFISDEVGELLEEVAPLAEELDPDSVDAALIRVTRRDWERFRRVPPELAGEMRHASGIAVAVWDEAKAASDFSLFAPHLERQLELKRRYIDCFPPAENPYDVLLQDYEEGMTTAEAAAVFAQLKPALLELVAELRDVDVDLSPLHGPFVVPKQRQAGERILAAFGSGTGTWRLDETSHPFAMNPGLGDVRLTTHYEETDLNSLFSTMHEFGHGVYEWGVDESLTRTSLGGGTSSAVHESQSRTWENLVGRSRGFWRWFYPQLQSIFSDVLGAVDEESFYRAFNAVRPSLVRVDADEVTYGLHIILRFELEQALLSGEVGVGDVQQAWNARVHEYLGLEVPDDAHGVLQDMHWSIGLFGYFPTYQLGNVMSVQFWGKAVEELGEVEEKFARGEFVPLRDWLREQVYRFGRMYEPRELLRRVTGSELDPAPYLDYLRTKFAP